MFSDVKTVSIIAATPSPGNVSASKPPTLFKGRECFIEAKEWVV